jgi:hypothetical protein
MRGGILKYDLTNYLAKYKRMMNVMMQEPQTYNVEKEKILQFDKLMLRLKGVLMDGLIFEATINSVRRILVPFYYYYSSSYYY